MEKMMEYVDAWMKSQKDFMEKWSQSQKEMMENWSEATKKFQESLASLGGGQEGPLKEDGPVQFLADDHGEFLKEL